MSGQKPNQFIYAQLASPITLAPNSRYILVSQEVSGGDQWYNSNPISVGTTGTVIGPVYSENTGNYVTVPAPNTSYGPVNLQIVPAAPASTTPAPVTPATTQNLPQTRLRNDYTGWVGMMFQTGASPLAVQALGRFSAPDNHASHIVKLVNVQTGQDIANGFATLNMQGSQAGTTVTGPTAGPVTLAANTGYLLVSNEVAGGDKWHDYGTVSAPSGTSIIGSAYMDGAGKYITVPAAGTSYVPLSMQTSVASASTAIAAGSFPQFSPQTRLRNDFSGWVGMTFQTGVSPLLVESLGRFSAPGNQASHSVKLVNAKTGQDIANATVAIPMLNSQAGSFVYGPLASPVTLTANTSYLLVSNEAAGGDKWYDYGPMPAPAGTSLNGSVYTDGAGNYVTVNAPNTSYVPLTLQSTVADTSSAGATTNNAATAGTTSPSAPDALSTTTASVTSAATSNTASTGSTANASISANTSTPATSTTLTPPSTNSNAATPPIAANAPAIIHVSTSVNAGETAVLIGDSFNTGNNQFGALAWLVPASTTASSIDTSTGGTPLAVLQSSSTSAMVQLPANLAQGVYAIQLWNASGRSKVVYLNRAEPSWSLGNANDQVYPGQTLRVIGRNFNTHLQGWLQGNGANYPLTLVKGGKWSATFTVPTAISPGSYSLRVHNGSGGNLGFANSLPVTVTASPAAWPATQYSVQAYGAKGDGTSDDTRAFQAALQAAKANGGGIVYIPAGNYLLTQQLSVPAFTELKADNPATTNLINQAAVNSVIVGSANFKVTGLTIQASASHRVIACPDDAVMYNDWGLSGKPASPCSNVTLSNLVIQHTTPNFLLQGYIVGTRALHFSGNDITVQNSTIHSQGMPTSFFNAHHVVIANNHLFVGYYCADGFWDVDESIYEFNEHAAEPGTSGDGLFVQGLSRKLYLEGNYFHDSLGTYGEGIVAGDSPYQSLWYGNSGASAGSVLAVPGVNWTPNQYVGSVVYVASGKGAYQRRFVTGNSANALTLESAWDVALDATSYVSLETDHSDGIIYDNRFSNVTSSVLLYAQSYGFVVDQNQSEGSGGSSCVAWNYDSTRNAGNPSAQRYFNNCYFNEWTNNTFNGSLNASNPNKNGGLISVLGQNMNGVSEYIANTAVLGPILDPSYMDQPLNEADYAAPIVGNIVRGNTLNAITQGPEMGSGTIGGIYNHSAGNSVCPAALAMPNGGATDTLVENNTVSNSGKGVLFYPLYEHTLISNNSFSGNQTNILDSGFTTCKGITGSAAAVSPPATLN